MSEFPTSGFLKVDGAELEYRHIGPLPADAPTIVMLHEGLGSASLWGPFPDMLQEATGVGVFVYSRAGYGNSSTVSLPRPLTYMHDEALIVLARILELIGLRRGILLGHSDGASIATIYAGSVQDHRVRGVALIAPHFTVEELSLRSIAAARRQYEKGDLKARISKWHKNVDAAFLGWNDAWLDPGFRNWDITEALTYIRVPIQIVQGANDQYGTVRQIEIAQEECYCPVDVTILPGVAHAPHRESPKATIDAIAAFVRRIFWTHGEGNLERAA